MTSEIRNIALVGSGNVASFMGHLFKRHGFHIASVSSRNPVTGQALADALASCYIQVPDPSDADLILLCVNDDEIAALSDSIAAADCAVCHCAGSIAMQTLSRHRSYGVIYPLQSIYAGIDVATIKVPFLIEANHEGLQQQLEMLLQTCGQSYFRMNSEQRLAYHLAAVFANNFTNAMMVATEDIAEKFNLDFKLLSPLIAQTLERMGSMPPKDVQTGPAKRQDDLTIRKHMHLLEGKKSLQDLYRYVSAYISGKFNQK